MIEKFEFEGKNYEEALQNCLEELKLNSDEIIVVDNVVTPIPCDTKRTYKVSEVLISDTKISGGNRYQKFDYSHFRHIEESIRPHKVYML